MDPMWQIILCRAYLTTLTLAKKVTDKLHQDSSRLATLVRSSVQARASTMNAGTSCPSSLQYSALTTHARSLNLVQSVSRRRMKVHMCRADADGAGSDKGTSSALWLRFLFI